MAENIFTFAPNLIGYLRIVLNIISFYFMPFDPWRATLCYLLSQLLDAVDGHVARYLGQSTKFGMMLDMLTDRCATACLVVTLAQFYPKYALVLQLLLSLDVASHWLHQIAALMRGSTSHKNVDPSTFWVLKLYYTSRKFLFCMCAGNELFFAMLYVCHFTVGPKVLSGLAFLPLTARALGLWQLLCAACAPVMAVKSAISLVHLVSGARTIGEIDVRERAAAKQKTK